MRADPHLWTNRVWREFRAGNLTRGYRDCLLTLRTFRGAGGAIHPSHATLADRAVCSPRTVKRALAMARQIGLVSWTERRVRASWRWLRTSNAYRLLTPGEPVQPGLRAPWPRRTATKGQTAPGGESKSFKGAALAEMMAAAAVLPDLLALRREAFQGKMLDKCRPPAADMSRFARSPERVGVIRLMFKTAEFFD